MHNKGTSVDQYRTQLAPFFENILAAFDDGVYVTDKNGTALYVNRMYQKLTGLTSEELLGHNVRVLLEKGVFDEIVNPIVVKRGKPATIVQVLKNDKRVVLCGYPVFDDDKNLTLVITLVRDVTLIGEMREQIIQQKKLISSYHDQISNMAKKSTVAVNAESGQSLKEIMSGLEKQVIQQTLDKHGSVKKASEVLGINRTTLFRKMR